MSGGSSKSDLSVEQSVSKALSSIRQSAGLLGPLASSSSSNKPIPPIPDGLRSILGTLLQAIRHSTTSLSLAFKPPITPPAAIQQLEKISDEYARCVSCVVGCAAHGTYSVLVDEWREGVESVGVELGRLIETLRDGPRINTATMGGQISTDDNPYLAHTGMVWDAVDRLSTLSWTEVEAVQKRIKGQRAIVDDAWAEFKEFFAEQDEGDGGEEGEEGEGDGIGEDGDEDEDDDDDEWGDLEKAMGGSKLNKEERSRAESAKTLLGLHQVLHASISRFIPPSSPNTPDPNFHQLITDTDSIVAAFDTAIGAMYPVQNELEIQTSLDELENRSKRVIASTEALLVELTEEREERKEQQVKLNNFSGRWLARLEAEKGTWEERKLSIKSLRDALP